MENDIEHEFILRQVAALDSTTYADGRPHRFGAEATKVAVNINRETETEYLEIHTVSGEKL